MPTLILVFIVAIIIDILIVRMRKRESTKPFIPEWSFDEGVTSSEESRADELLMKFGKQDAISLPESFVVHQSIRDFVEHYATLKFDDYTMDYSRKEFLRGEEKEECWKGFYCIGGDGGEISYWVRISTTDEKIYAFDMECSKRPEPYASNIRRFIVMRYKAWREMQKIIEEDEKSQRKKSHSKSKSDKNKKLTRQKGK